MRREHFEAIGPVCPTCRTDTSHPLQIGAVYDEVGPHILQGIVRCTNPACLREFPILDGVPMLIGAVMTAL